MGILTVLFNKQIEIPRCGRSCRIRTCYKRKHLCSVLCVQCGAGGTADYIHKFRRTAYGQNKGNLAICVIYCGVFRNFLDGFKPFMPQFIHQNIYETNRADFKNSSADYTQVFCFVFAFAAEYFCYLLLPGDFKGENRL